MKQVISLSYGEVALKGGNRKYFVDKLMKNLKLALRGYATDRIYQDRTKFYIECPSEIADEVYEQARKVFGFVVSSRAVVYDKDPDRLADQALEYVSSILEKDPTIKSFKFETKRNDKKFPMKSMDINPFLGGVILKKFGDLHVDVHQPDLLIRVDIRNAVYFYSQKEQAAGGLPIGTTGRSVLLLSGGIDSPVAGYMMAKRGVELLAVNFNSYPFTSERSDEKVLDLVKKLTPYIGSMDVHQVNILPIQKAIRMNCPEKEMTILSRRFMMRIAERIAKEQSAKSLITGESLGQVASQTMEGLQMTNSVVSLPVFRPLIGMDKTEIIEIAQRIDTFETSILPFDDCCSVFLPKHPVTHPKLGHIENSESALDIEALLNEVMESRKIVTIKKGD
ncbi:tRNA 4-thiouridine(8) synthase ThiI [Gottschalkiaceae bacterium SANA]|nr:tRNA 4-thiouridine(8) synthase ThiI [Gottschalkiaceae bacterium SANA]